MNYPVTPDGRYFVVRGRLWRCADPKLSPAKRQKIESELMAARRAVKAVKRLDDPDAMKAARDAVNATKIALGERGPVWWKDGAKDFNMQMAKDTPYAQWFASLASSQ